LAYNGLVTLLVLEDGSDALTDALAGSPHGLTRCRTTTARPTHRSRTRLWSGNHVDWHTR
jgi:hypothetical protein